MKLPTVEIVNPRNPGFMLRINQSDFNAKLHTLWTAKENAIQTEETETPKAIELEGRYLELTEMSWHKIKRLHEDEYQLGEYPGKDEAIAAILQHEGL